MKETGSSNKAIARSEYWREVIQQQAASGQSVSTFCAERGLTEQSLYSWKKRLSEQAPVSFALVTTDRTDRSQSIPLELDLGGSRRLRIPCGVDAATLRTVLAVLGEQP
jgi:transposase-like protein